MAETHEAVRGLSIDPVHPLRYDGNTIDPWEATGMLVALIPPNARVLDVGCGTGSGSSHIRDARAARVVGVEPDSDRAAKARTRGFEVVNAAFTAAAVAGLGPFDTIVFADVLEHLVDPAAALELARSLLVPGGSVIASIPNVAHWTVRFDLLFGHFAYRYCGIRDATHLRWFNKTGVFRLFRETGFEITSHGVTAGADLPEYSERFPWRFVPYPVRRRLVHVLRWGLPNLFGCQHIVSARPASLPAS